MQENVLNPIMLIDNEFENISTLQQILSTYIASEYPHYTGLGVITAEGAADAISQMVELKSCNTRLSAIVCDYHLSDDYDIEGDDLVRLIRGSVGYCISRDKSHCNLNLKKINSYEKLQQIIKVQKNKDIVPFLKEHFHHFIDYEHFVHYYCGNSQTAPCFAFFCGDPRQIDKCCLYDIRAVQKRDLEDDSDPSSSCEYKVLEILDESGIFDSYALLDSFESVPRFSPSAQPDQRRYYSSQKLTPAATRAVKEIKKSLPKRKKK